MRIFAKFFLCATLVISIALLLSGYFLITLSYENAIKRETERALNQYQYDRFTVQANIIANADNLEKEALHDICKRLSSELSGLAAFFATDMQIIFSALPPQAAFSLLNDITDNTHVMEFQTVNGDTYIMVSGMITQSGISLYFLTAHDISSVIFQREQMTQNFVRIYAFTVLFSMIIIFILSAFITNPIKKMNRVAAAIARGHYHKRLTISSNDEIGELANSFNLMADAVEDKIGELLENARQKEDFVANFAHELKTPLTSVIGYADMIYQKTLPTEQVKDAAWYILNEGLRLEALSFKLMDLIVLSRRDFILEEMNAEELFAEIAGSLKPFLADKDVALHFTIQPSCIKVEYDLFKCLMFNLIDNAIKAGCKKIEINSSQKNENRYHIRVIDDGRGIPASELTKITEAFYTVDKSRSRKQRGAGIGLSLAAKIAEIHGGTLLIDSTESVGTVVQVDLVYEESDDDD